MPPDDETVELRRRKSKHNDDVREDLCLGRGEQADPDGSPWGWEQGQGRTKRLDRSRPLWFRGMKGLQNHRQACKQHVHLPHDHVLGFRIEAGLWMVESGGATFAVCLSRASGDRLRRRVR
jgi:hypothetical protein